MKKIVCLVLICVMNFGFVGVSYGEEKCEYVEGEKYEYVTSLTYSNDEISFAYVARKNEKEFIVKDGKVHKGYKEIDKISLKYSSNGTFFSYRAKKNGKWIYVINGIEYDKYDDVYDLEYSPDGKNFSFQFMKDGKIYIFKDGKEIGVNYESAIDGKYSSNGRFMYIGKENGKSFVVENGKIVSNLYDTIYGFSFSLDGSEYSIEIGEKGKIFVVKNGKRYDKGYGVINLLEYVGNRNLFYIGQEGGYLDKYVLIKNGEEVSKEYDEINFPVFSPDYKNFSFEVKENEKRYIIKEGKEIGKKYDKSFAPYYSTNGKFTYHVSNENKTFIVIDGKKIGSDNQRVGIIEYGSNNKYSFKAMNKGNWFIIQNDSIVSNNYDNIYISKYSPNGKKLVSVAKRAKFRYILENGVELSGKYDDIISTGFSEIFSPLGDNYYVRVERNGKRFIVKNGKKVGDQYEEASYPVFSYNGEKFAFRAEKNGKQFVVQEVCTGTNQTNTITSTKPNLKQKPTLTRQYILSKSKIKKLPNGELIITKLDEFIDKYKNNKETLNKIYTKLGEIRSKISDEEKLILIDYLEGNIGLDIYNEK